MPEGWAWCRLSQMSSPILRIYALEPSRYNVHSRGDTLLFLRAWAILKRVDIDYSDRWTDSPTDACKILIDLLLTCGELLVSRNKWLRMGWNIEHAHICVVEVSAIYAGYLHSNSCLFRCRIILNSVMISLCMQKKFVSL